MSIFPNQKLYSFIEIKITLSRKNKCIYQDSTAVTMHIVNKNKSYTNITKKA